MADEEKREEKLDMNEEEGKLHEEIDQYWDESRYEGSEVIHETEEGGDTYTEEGPVPEETKTGMEEDLKKTEEE